MTRKAKAVPAAETPKETKNSQSEPFPEQRIETESSAQTPSLVDSSGEAPILIAIKNMLDEREKTLPATIRNEVQKMLQEAREAQQKQIQTPNSVPTGTPQFEAPPTTGAPNMMSGIAQALPAILNMVGANSGQDELTKQFMSKVMESGLNNLTLGSQFLTAITQMVMKNVGTGISTQVASAIVPTTVAP